MCRFRSAPIAIFLLVLPVMAGCPDSAKEGVGGGGTPNAVESCGDGLDNDGNGRVDEGCPCTSGQTQACWPGPPDQRNQGACHDGIQTCGGGDIEFIEWGPCEGATLPGSDSAGDGLDSDCGGSDGPDESIADCGLNEFGEGCFNGHDEDCDGLIDCQDPDCAAKCAAECVATEDRCNDGLDNDCDMVIDCGDVNCGDECGGSGLCVAESCVDAVDNDCDGRADCGDVDCAGNEACGGAVCVPPVLPDEYCWDGWDDDCDGFTDCVDPDCSMSTDCNPSCVCVPGQYRWCDTPTNCAWGRQQCDPSGEWGACIETAERPPGCGGISYDPSCCAAADNACCQDFPANGSIGECDGIINCM
jgi:hypothetical protein